LAPYLRCTYRQPHLTLSIPCSLASSRPHDLINLAILDLPLRLLAPVSGRRIFCETAVAVTAVLTVRLVQVLLPRDCESTLAEALAVNNQHETKTIPYRRHIIPRSQKSPKTLRDSWCSFSYNTLAPAGSSSFSFRNAHLPLTNDGSTIDHVRRLVMTARFARSREYHG
jgi:hypothetical protein